MEGREGKYGHGNADPYIYNFPETVFMSNHSFYQIIIKQWKKTD